MWLEKKKQWPSTIYKNTVFLVAKMKASFQYLRWLFNFLGFRIFGISLEKMCFVLGKGLRFYRLAQLTVHYREVYSVSKNWCVQPLVKQVELPQRLKPFTLQISGQVRSSPVMNFRILWFLQEFKKKKKNHTFPRDVINSFFMFSSQ